MVGRSLSRAAVVARHLVVAQSAGMASAPAAAAAGLGRLRPDATALFVCDVQERFRPIIAGFPAVVDTARRMARAADALALPVVLTAQYPERLGATVPEVASVLPAGALLVAKTRFSMLVPEVEARLEALPAVRAILIVGIETHVCVLQTTLDLLERGYAVHILTDGVSSQRLGDRATALARLERAGAFLATSEMAMFELMRDTAHPAFRAVSALCKEARPEQLPPL